ncbi:MAG TPA: oligopeptide:H+ symporter, partial [Gemmatimonadales bacterium]
AAGVGMAFGLVQYVLGKKHLEPGIARLTVPPSFDLQKLISGAVRYLSVPIAAVVLVSLAKVKVFDLGQVVLGAIEIVTWATVVLVAIRQIAARFRGAVSNEDWKRITAIVVFFMAASLFWGAYEQAGTSLTLFADRYVDRHVFGFEFPAGWYISVQALFTIIVSPIFAWLWIKLGSRQPSSPGKFTLALMFAGLAFLLLVPAGGIAQGGVKIGPWWLVGCYFLEELGEVALSPVGLSVVTKLAPTRIVGIMMGVWFLSNAAGNKVAGWMAQFISSTSLDKLFLINAAVMFGATLVMFVMIKPVRKLMGGVN